MIEITKEQVLNFIRCGFWGDSKDEYNTRSAIIKNIPDIKHKDKKKGVCAILDATNIVFYVSYGSIGFTESIVLNFLSILKITDKEIFEVLKIINTEYKIIEKKKQICTKGFIFYFIQAKQEEWVLNNVISVNNKDNSLKDKLSTYLIA